MACRLCRGEVQQMMEEAVVVRDASVADERERAHW
jgi:hypothetical protein